MDPYIPPTPDWQHDRPLAEGGYVCYLRDPDQHSNVASSHAGAGKTPREAAEAALYWANQVPWCRVVPRSRAPRWAIEEADAARRQAEEDTARYL